MFKISGLLPGLIALLVFIKTGDSLCQSHQARLSQVDVQHYTFEVDLSDSTNIISGRARVRVKFQEPVDTLHLDLVAQEPNGLGMKVSQVTLKGAEQPFIHQGDSLLILAETGSYSGSLKFHITYSGVPADGMLIANNLYGDRTFFGDNWPNRARHWLPTVDHPSDKATVEFKVKAPSNYKVVANGERLSETKNDGITVTHWKTQVPIPTKVMVIGAAAFDIKKEAKNNNQKVPVSHWVYPQEATEAHQSFDQTADILDYLIERIGPYPYTKLVNVQSKTRYGGMENAGNIFYSEQAVQSSMDIELLITHEIAHQWFGNSVTEENWHHVWLSEGFATYLTNLYVEDNYGTEAFRQRLSEQRDRIIGYHKLDPKPVIDSHESNYDSLLNANTYQKGSWFLHMLRKKIGDSNFDQVLKEYYRVYRDKNALTEDFRKIAERLSGQDLGGFFTQWLYHSGHPLLDINWVQSEDHVSVSIEQKQEKLFTFPLQVKITDVSNETHYEFMEIDQRNFHTTLKVSGEIKRMEIDPKVWLLYQPYRD